MNIFFKLTLTLCISIIIVIICYFARKRKFLLGDITFSLMVFIATALIFEVTDICKRIHTLEEQDIALSQVVINLFQDSTPFADFFNLGIISNIRTGAIEGQVIVPEAYVPNYWLKTLMFFDKTYFATSHIDLDEGWTRAYTKIGQDIQKMKIDQGKQVKRVFIIDTKYELESVLPTLKEQRANGIEARYIFLQDIQSHPILGTTELESLDFVLIDNEFLCLIVLDSKRKISHLKLMKDRKEYEKYSNYYSHLFNEAHGLQ